MRGRIRQLIYKAIWRAEMRPFVIVRLAFDRSDKFDQALLKWLTPSMVTLVPGLPTESWVHCNASGGSYARASDPSLTRIGPSHPPGVLRERDTVFIWHAAA